MKGGGLDEVTAKTFAWIRNRPTAAERELAAGKDDQNSALTTDEKSPEVIARDYRADKGRIRRIGEKVVRLLTKPYALRMQLVSPEWFERIEQIPLE